MAKKGEPTTALIARRFPQRSRGQGRPSAAASAGMTLDGGESEGNTTDEIFPGQGRPSAAASAGMTLDGGESEGNTTDEIFPLFNVAVRLALPGVLSTPAPGRRSPAEWGSNLLFLGGLCSFCASRPVPPTSPAIDRAFHGARAGAFRRLSRALGFASLNSISGHASCLHNMLWHHLLLTREI